MQKAAFFALVLFAAALAMPGCLTQQAAPATPLGPAQVHEYQGKPLSSVDDFRENSIAGPQHVNISNYQLEISGLVEKPANYSYSQVVDGFAHYEKVVTLNCVEGWSATILWKGVLARDLFAKSAPKKEANTVIFHAYDGYTTSFPLEYFYSNDIIVAYEMNNATLLPQRGFPFQLVAESKWGYKWIKWITKIEFSDDENYRGYWESRGYSNSGNLGENFYG